MTTAFVTRATRGVGRAISVVLAESDAPRIACGRGKPVLADMRADHGAETVAVELTDRSEQRKLTANIRIDAPIDGALRRPDGKRFRAQDAAQINFARALNLTAALHPMRGGTPSMQAGACGALVYLAPNTEQAPGRDRNSDGQGIARLRAVAERRTGRDLHSAHGLPVDDAACEHAAARAIPLTGDRLEDDRSIPAKAEAGHDQVPRKKIHDTQWRAPAGAESCRARGAQELWRSG